MSDKPETTGYDDAREIVEQAMETRDVIQLSRMGAVPYLRYTPYENNRGVTVGMWSCISVYPPYRPSWENDDWEVNQIHTPWVVKRVANTWRERIEVLPADETPFAGEMLRWDTDSGGDLE